MGKVCFFKKVLVLNPYPQTPFPRKGAILLGLPPLVPVGGFAPATPFLSTIEVFRQTGTSLLCGRLADCGKSMFFQKSACPQSLSPNPFPPERGYITGATAPSPCRGLRPCDPIFINDRSFSTDWNEPPVWEARKEITYSFSSC